MKERKKRRKEKEKAKDVYVDGGLLCNYPIHAFDGKLSRSQLNKYILEIRSNLSNNYMLSCIFRSTKRIFKRGCNIYLFLFIRSFSFYIKLFTQSSLFMHLIVGLLFWTDHRNFKEGLRYRFSHVYMYIICLLFLH